MKNRTCASSAPVSPRLSNLRVSPFRELLLVVVGLLAMAGGSPRLLAQVTQVPVWTQQSPSTVPPGRYGAAMAYDAATGQIVLFGGIGTSGYMGDTWIWNGSTWTQQNPTNSPGVRTDASMAYDAATGQIVLFGGVNGNWLSDTWTWDGSNWTQQSPSTSPPARFNAGMAYDGSSSQIVLFGGDGSSSVLNDTWVWSGSNWTQQSPASSPSARTGAGMAYDAATSQIVLFGGASNPETPLNDTWTWNGITWTQQSPSTSPAARTGAAMAYDPVSNLAVLFGGMTPSLLNDTWTWNGSTWTEQSLTSGLIARTAAAMAYDVASGQTVLFGGEAPSDDLSDTWTQQAVAVNLATANVCPAAATTPSPCSTSATIAFSVAAGTTIGSIHVLTQGSTISASGSALDFNATSPDGSGTLCAAQTYATQTTCTVDVTFAPARPGARNGAVVIEDGSGNMLATTYVYGVGDAPQVTYNQGYNPSATNLLGAGFSGPQGVAVDAHGDVFVADTASIKEMTPGCASASCAVTLASGNGVLSNNLPGLAVDGAGNVFVADYGGNKVEEILAAGGYTTVNTLGGSFTFGSPTGVAVDGSGNVYVADYNNNAVEEIPVAGGYTTVTPMGGGFAAPQGVAVDGSGNVYVADTNNSAIKELPAGCASVSCVTTLGGGFSQPAGVAVGAAGIVYVGDTSNSLLKQMPAGCASSSCVATLGGSFSGLEGVAVDSNGDVYAADTNDVEVKQLDFAVPPALPAFAMPTYIGSTDATDGPMTVTVANIGNEPLILTTPATGSNPSYALNFPENTADTNLCGTSSQLLAGASCDLSANFAPTSVDINLGSVVLTDNALNVETAGVGSATQTIGLSGTGVVPPPTITGDSPSYGPIAGGTVVAIAGTNLTGATAVNFGSTPASFTVTSDSSIIATSPLGLGTVNITVTTASGTSAIGSQDRFTYLQTVSPTNSSLSASPASATAGASTTLTATVEDASGNPINGAVVNFAVSSPSSQAALSATSATTVNGIATVTLTDTNAETATVSAGLGSPYSGTLNTATATFVAPAYVVTVASDTTTGVAGNCINPNLSTAGNTNCSLRDAVAAANALTGVDTNISFSPTAFAGPQTITLINGMLNLTANTTVTGTTMGSGSSLTNLVTISGNSASRVLYINGGVNAVLSSLTLTHGTTNDANGGGAVYVAGNLTLNNDMLSGNTTTSGVNGGALAIANGATFSANHCTFANNASAANGGAINVGVAAIATIGDSTFFGNTTAVSGGAIGSAGTLQISNSTFTGNVATTVRGGAIYSTQEAALTLVQTTMVGNSSATYGGAVYLNSGSLTLQNSFVLGNTSGSYPDLDATSSGDSTLVSNGGNVFNQLAGASEIAANLTSLGNYGGPTQTMVPLPGSAAICAGTFDNPTGLTTDQRGLPRTTTYGSTSCLDAGAVQSNYSLSFTMEPTPTPPVTAIVAGANFQAAVTLEESGSPFTPPVSLPLSLTGTGTLTNGTATTANAVASYSTLQVSAVGTNDTLTANLALNGALTPPLAISAVSSSFAVEQVTATTAVSSATLTQGHAVTPFTPVAGSGGTAPLTYSISPALPSGISINAASGAISGTPEVASSAATYTVTVTDTNGITGSATFSLAIDGPLVATGSPVATALTQGHAASFTPVTGSGGTAPLNYNISPALPSGLTLTSSSGLITGMPTGTIPAVSYTVTVTDANSATATASFTLAVNATLTTTAVQPATILTQSHAASFTPVTTVGGTTPLTYSVSPALPSGLSLNSASGTIIGTPTGTSSAATYTVTVTDANGATATAAFSLTINRAVAATVAQASTTLTQNRAATPFTPVTGSGGTSSLSYGVTPALPSGLTLNAASGTIAGTPTGTSSAATYTVTITDANSATATAIFSLTINSALTATSAIPSTLLPVNVNASPFTPVTIAGGTTPLTYRVTPTLPVGLSLNTSSGAISGTPTSVSMAATYTMSILDANGATAAANFTLQVGQLQPAILWSQPGPISYGTALGSILGAVAQSDSTTVAGSYAYTVTGSAAGSIAVTSATLLPAGTYTLGVTFTPADTTVYKSATSSVSLTVDKILPSVILNVTPNPVLVQNTVTFTATVSSAVSSPTGTMSFYDASSTAPLGTSPVSAGVAVLPISTLTVGSHSITAIYNGDSNFVTQTSSPVPETVQDFSLSMSGGTAAQTVVPGGTATFTLALSPVGGSTFPAPVSFTASGLPPGATATFTPQTLSAGSGATNVTLSIQTAMQTARLKRDQRFGGGFVSVALGMLLLPFSRRLRRSARKLGRGGSLALLLLMGLGAMAGLTGCGTSGGFFDQSPKNYVVTVTATSGALQHTSTVTLNLQ